PARARDATSGSHGRPPHPGALSPSRPRPAVGRATTARTSSRQPPEPTDAARPATRVVHLPRRRRGDPGHARRDRPGRRRSSSDPRGRPGGSPVPPRPTPPATFVPSTTDDSLKPRSIYTPRDDAPSTAAIRRRGGPR